MSPKEKVRALGSHHLVSPQTKKNQAHVKISYHKRKQHLAWYPLSYLVELIKRKKQTKNTIMNLRQTLCSTGNSKKPQTTQFEK